MIQKGMQVVVEARDLRRIEWLVQALFVDLGVRMAGQILDWFAFLDSWELVGGWSTPESKNVLAFDSSQQPPVEAMLNKRAPQFEWDPAMHTL
jgi:hypothetical protein